jgi:hypothetical protein
MICYLAQQPRRKYEPARPITVQHSPSAFHFVSLTPGSARLRSGRQRPLHPSPMAPEGNLRTAGECTAVGCRQWPLHAQGTDNQGVAVRNFTRQPDPRASSPWLGRARWDGVAMVVASSAGSQSPERRYDKGLARARAAVLRARAFGER